MPNSFVPFGIVSFDGTPQRGYINFPYTVSGADAKKIVIQIRDGSTEIYKEEITNPDKLKKGERYTWSWHGFDNNGILDTAKLTQTKNLNCKITAISPKGNTYFKTIDFKLSYEKVNWVDVRIDRPNKIIQATVRINLRDGGAVGIKPYNEIVFEGTFGEKVITLKEERPWEAIPKSALNYYGKPPITTQQRSFEQLRDLALRGIEKHWSRNTSNKEGKSISIEYQKYQVFVKAIASDKGMVAPKIVYQSNCEEGRPRNWEASRILYFAEGYLYDSKWIGYKDNPTIQRDRGWYYRSEDKMEERRTFILSQPLIEDFMMTAAHEIGHEILVSFGGFAAHIHSKTHKGTSTLLTQKTIEDEKNLSKTNYPSTGEIDLMKYYSNYYEIERTVASEFDVIHLIGLTKMKVE